MSNLILEDLFEASYKGASFLFRRGSKEFGRKTVSHEYVGTKDRYVEDLSGLDDIFTITGVITGPNYLDKRNSFESALKSKGPGLLIHPFYGPVTCALISPVQASETPEQLNVASYSLKFAITLEEPRFPAESEAINATILDAVSAIDNLLNTYISDNFSAATVANFNDAREVLTEITGVISGTISSSDTTEATSGLTSRIKDFADNINTYISNPSSLADELLGIFSDWQEVTDTPNILLENNANFLTFGDDYVAPRQITQERIDRNKNRDVLNNTMKAISLSNYYDAATSQDYFSIQEAEMIEDTAETGFQSIPYFNPSVYTELQDMRNLVREFIKEQKSTAYSVTDVRINEMPVSILSHKYYGDTSFLDPLVELNDVQNVAEVSGNFKIFRK